jgi:hypothetical protein
MMQNIRLKRTGQDDLVFTGVLLASVDDQGRSETSFSWLKLSLYQTSTRAYILGVALHRYSSSGYKNMRSSVAFASIDDIRDFLCNEECQEISELIEILLRQAIKTKKALEKGNYPNIQSLFEQQGQTSCLSAAY